MHLPASTDRPYLIRYYMMAVGSVIVNFGSFWVLYHALGVWYIAALNDRQFLRRYLLVGLGNLSINFGVFWILYHFFGVWYLLASCIGFGARFIFKFSALRFWVFGHRTKKSLGTHFWYFSLLEAGSYVTSLPLLAFLVEWLRFPPPAAVILTIITFYFIGMIASRTIFKAENT